MTARFAGSRSLDERRRRRLAGEWDESASGRAAASAAEETESTTSETPSRRGRRRKPARRLPLRRLISPRLWKHGVLAFSLFALGAGLLWGGFESQRIGEALGPDVRSLVAFENAKLIRGFGGLLLFVAAQFALLIWYVRSRSRCDYSGRYRSWAWAAGAGFLFSASVSLELHLAWSAMLRYSLHLEIPNIGTLCWLAPALGCGSVLFRDLYADMRDCRSSVAFLRLALLGWSAAAVQQLGYGLSLESRTEALAVSAAALFGHYCLFLSMLLHARFVIFVSAEPPEPRTPLWRTALSAVLRPLRASLRVVRRRRRDETSQDDSPRPDSVKAGPQPKQSAPAGKDRTTAKPQPPPLKPKKGKKSKAKPKAAPSAASEPEETRAAAAETPKSEKNLRVDGPHETMAMPKGLSKSERRRLRKQQARERA